MTRPLGAVLALCCLVPAASASLAGKSQPLPTELRVALASQLQPRPREVPPPPEIELTDTTEVFLDGKRVKLKDVPANAPVQRVYLNADGRTADRIDFASPK